MSAPVDVLAVMDWAAEQVRAGAVRASDAEQRRVDEGIREARAAVAELIKQADLAQTMLPEGSAIRHDLRAALARCGGTP